jgi:hypothetical protein
MIGFTGALKIFLALKPQDMRKSFNGRFAATEHELGEDPGRARFLFFQQAANRIKTLYFDKPLPTTSSPHDPRPLLQRRPPKANAFQTLWSLTRPEPAVPGAQSRIPLR